MFFTTNFDGITKEIEFETQRLFNDYLMGQFVDAVNAEKEATDKKRKLALLINEQCPDKDKASGTVKVEGLQYKATITRSQVPKYPPTDKLQDSLLQQLFTCVEEARLAIKLSFEERPVAMTEFLDGCTASDFEGMAPTERDIVKKVLEARYFQASQPQIKVSRLDE